MPTSGERKTLDDFFVEAVRRLESGTVLTGEFRTSRGYGSKPYPLRRPMTAEERALYEAEVVAGIRARGGCVDVDRIRYTLRDGRIHRSLPT